MTRDEMRRLFVDLVWAVVLFVAVVVALTALLFWAAGSASSPADRAAAEALTRAEAS